LLSISISALVVGHQFGQVGKDYRRGWGRMMRLPAKHLLVSIEAGG